MEGGPFLVLMQEAEFMIIGGSALGALLISAPAKTLKLIIQKVLGTLKGSSINTQTYLDLLKLMFEVFQMSRKDGLIALESHIEKPEESAIFANYPQFLTSTTSSLSCATPSGSSSSEACLPMTWNPSWTRTSKPITTKGRSLA